MSKPTFLALSKRLWVRSLALVLISLAVFASVLALLLNFGLSSIIGKWHEDESKALHQYIEATLQEVHSEATRQGSVVTQQELSQVFEGLPFSPEYLVILKANGSLLYNYKEAQRGLGRARIAHKNLKEIHQWRDVYSPEGSLLFRFSVHLPTFDERESNRFLIAASKLLLIWTLALAAFLSLLLAYLFTRPLKRESKSVVQALQSMATGQRDVPLVLGKVAEFNDIALASQVLQEHLVQEEQLRRQWAEDIAHDLRTPLSVLQGQMEAMVDGVFELEQSRLVKLLLETGKLESLVNSLALLSRLEDPGFIPKIENIRLDSMLQTLTEQYSDQAKQKGVHITLLSSQAMVEADPSLLERSLGNLIMNAIKHGKEGGTIEVVVTVGDDSKATTLSIENEGTISEEVLKHMFDRLYRGQEARSTEGSGLGLAIVKAIVEAHRWSITVKSDKTTKVFISFT